MPLADQSHQGNQSDLRVDIEGGKQIYVDQRTEQGQRHGHQYDNGVTKAFELRGKRRKTMMIEKASVTAKPPVSLTN